MNNWIELENCFYDKRRRSDVHRGVQDWLNTRVKLSSNMNSASRLNLVTLKVTIDETCFLFKKETVVNAVSARSI